MGIIKSKGFTLIEMIIVMVLTGIVVAITATILNTGFINYFSSVRSTGLSTQAAVVMTKMSKEFQQASSFSTISASNVTFTTMGGSTISYSWSNPTLTRTGSSTQTMSNVVTSLNISYYQANFSTTSTPSAVRAVTLAMTLSNGNETVPLINTVYIRNM